MSNLFPKYKKSHTLQTGLPVKNNSFSFHFPLISPTAQPLQQVQPPLGNPLTRYPSECSGFVCKRDPGTYSQSREYHGNPSSFTKVTLVEQAAFLRPVSKCISHCSSISIKRNGRHSPWAGKRLEQLWCSKPSPSAMAFLAQQNKKVVVLDALCNFNGGKRSPLFSNQRP